MNDIYFEKKYCEINESIEDGQAESFVYDGKEGNITHNFIKREIDDKLNGETFYDIVSPYGYGGPVINKCCDYYELLNKFNEEFSSYCKQNNIISEFIRFHPVVKNHEDFERIYNVGFSRYTIGTNLKYEDPFQEEFSKSCRKKIRKLLREGMTYNVIERPTDISEFIKFYYSTMDRNKATNFYYFSEAYFSSLLENYRENIVLVKANFEDKTIAMGLYFVYDKYIHIHLSGTLSEYINKSPAYILRYGISEWGKENGYELIHHGGGRSSSLEDGLYKFKKQFGKNTNFEFYLGKKIWNQEVYDEFCRINNVDTETDFFPAYRSTQN